MGEDGRTQTEKLHEIYKVRLQSLIDFAKQDEVEWVDLLLEALEENSDSVKA